MQSAKETVSNVGASAKSGMAKTKAVVQEKVERMAAHDPMEKEMATQRKEEKINQAELNKQEIRESNAAAKQASGVIGGTTTTATAGIHGPGHATGMHQMSAMPGHGTGQPAGQVTEGTVGARPVGINTGTGRTLGSNPRVGGETNQGYKTGGSFI